ncbi:MAG: PIG-L deacetylase family protein [Gemmatimonadales bacterium]
MLSLIPALPDGRPLRLLCLGAHADDIEIGCGGTVLRLLAERPGTEVSWIVFSATPERRREAEASAARFLRGAVSQRVQVFDFPDTRFPAAFDGLKDAFAALSGGAVPDVILSHRRADRHQDHRTVAELTWNSWRDHLILEYEIPKYEGDLVPPNCYVPLDPDVAERKVALLLEGFPSQQDKHWFDAETFRGLLRLRGLEAAARSGYAEAFHASKLVLGTGA